MAVDPKAGTPGEEQEGGTPEGAGTPATEPEGGTEGNETPEQLRARLAETQAENERLKQAHEQSLGEKSELERLRREREQPPPTRDPSIQSQIDEERARIEALAAAARQGDPVAQELISFKRQTIEELQMQQIPEADRPEVRNFYQKNRNRFADPEAAMYALRGLHAEHEKNKPPETKRETKPDPKPPTVATGARHAAPPDSGKKPMAFTAYLAMLERGGPEADKAMADKDKGALLLDYNK